MLLLQIFLSYKETTFSTIYSNFLCILILISSEYVFKRLNLIRKFGAVLIVASEKLELHQKIAIRIIDYFTEKNVLLENSRFLAKYKILLKSQSFTNKIFNRKKKK